MDTKINRSIPTALHDPAIAVVRRLELKVSISFALVYDMDGYWMDNYLDRASTDSGDGTLVDVIFVIEMLGETTRGVPVERTD